MSCVAAIHGEVAFPPALHISLSFFLLIVRKTLYISTAQRKRISSHSLRGRFQLRAGRRETWHLNIQYSAFSIQHHKFAATIFSEGEKRHQHSKMAEGQAEAPSSSQSRGRRRGRGGRGRGRSTRGDHHGGQGDHGSDSAQIGQAASREEGLEAPRAAPPSVSTPPAERGRRGRGRGADHGGSSRVTNSQSDQTAQRDGVAGPSETPVSAPTSSDESGRPRGERGRRGRGRGGAGSAGSGRRTNAQVEQTAQRDQTAGPSETPILAPPSGDELGRPLGERGWRGRVRGAGQRSMVVSHRTHGRPGPGPAPQPASGSMLSAAAAEFVPGQQVAVPE